MLELANHPAAQIVNDALESAEHAGADLRELVRGIMPTALRHGGLRAAVGSLLRYIALPVSAEVMPDRLPTHVETTAYFVVAMTPAPAQTLPLAVPRGRAAHGSPCAARLGFPSVPEVAQEPVGVFQR